MGLLSLNYRRPEFVEKGSFRNSTSSISVNEKSDSSLRSGQSGPTTGIPESLGFDKIISGGTCPPCTVRDFMNYLIYIEHSAENLQFFLWYKEYEKRFHSASTSDIGLAPEWTQAMEDDTIAKLRKENAQATRQEPVSAEMFKGTDFDKRSPGDHRGTEVSNPFSTPPRTPGGGGDQDSIFASSQATSTAANYRSLAADAYLAAGVKQPFSIQPYRAEMDRVIATYIMERSPRQLNLSDRERTAAIHALAYTTHPTALRSIFNTVDSLLRRQAHPNFIRWSICNGNPARVFFARALGGGLILASLAVALVLTLSKAGRGWRALSAIGFVLGISTLVAAYKGMCVVLHGMHHRHVRPWELFVDGDVEQERTKMSFESFDSSNSYEDEPWIVKYENRNIIRKIFDREVWIQEPALRQIQDTIFVQAMLSALLLAGVIVAIFVAVPGGRFF